MVGVLCERIGVVQGKYVLFLVMVFTGWPIGVLDVVIIFKVFVVQGVP